MDFYYDGTTHDYFYFGMINNTVDYKVYYTMVTATAATKTVTASKSVYYSSSVVNGAYLYGCWVDSTTITTVYSYISYTTVG